MPPKKGSEETPESCLQHLSEDIIARIVEKVFEKMLPLMREYLDTEVGKINKEIIFLKEENNDLRNRIEYLEIKEKSCDLIFEGIKESTYAEATSDVGSQDVKLTRMDTVSSVINCCR